MKEQSTNGNGDGRAFKTIQSLLMAALIGSTAYLAKTTLDNTTEITKLRVTVDERSATAASDSRDNKATQNELLKSVATLHDEVNSLDFRMKAIERNVR